ncbi:PHP domain protein [compost metagenome]
MSYKLYPRGSEWRKWDLHTHTPLDFEWLDSVSIESEEDKRNFAQQYVAFALQQELSVIAVTDHNFCDSIDQLLIPYIQIEAKKHNIKILPGFEITANEGSGVHLLVIFPESTSLGTIKSVVDQLFIPGAQKIMPKIVPYSSKNIDQIKEVIDSSGLDSVMIFAHADRENGVLHNQTINGHIRIDLWKKPFINICQLSKATSEYQDNFYSSVIKGHNSDYKREMTYIVASDCRTVNIDQSQPNRTYLGEKFAWIKADPTLDGLKQTIYEPDRVRIQASNPQNDFHKSYFSKIIINSPMTIFPGKPVKFNKTEIMLNPNLVTLIGGRGTGKSLILDTLGKTFGKGSERSKQINTEGLFSVTYTKEDNSTKDFQIGKENNLEYLHVHQGQVKEIVEDPYLLDAEIKSMLGFIDFSENKAFESELKSLINRIIRHKDWFEEVGEHGKLINDKTHNEAQKRKYEDLLSNITVEKNRELIEKFSNNNSEIASRRNIIQDIINVRTKAHNLISEINNDIKVINQNQYTVPLPIIELNTWLEELSNAYDKHTEKIQSLNDENETIKSRFIQIGIRDDISTLLQKVAEYQIYIERYKKKLDEISEREKQYPKFIEKRTELVSQIQTELNSQVQEINSNWKELKNGKDGWNEDQRNVINLLLRDIEITSEINFDSHAFYELICSNISKTRFKTTKNETSEERIRKCITVESYEDYINLISNNAIIEMGDGNKLTLEQFYSDNGYFNKNGDSEFLRSLYEEQYRIKYVKAITKIKYKGKEPSELSIGQRGTLYVCLKLATNPFSTPFVFDQPEDDLDNQFIVNELIPIFRTLKQYRQIIIATHNANLVVNADAEQVIVADNTCEILSYVSGSLENTFRNNSITDTLLRQGIREHVCDILEGGERAFEKRERKYGLR